MVEWIRNKENSLFSPLYIEKALQDKRALIVNGLKILLAEPNLKVR